MGQRTSFPRRVWLYWGDTCVLDGRATSVCAFETARAHLAGNFAGQAFQAWLAGSFGSGALEAVLSGDRFERSWSDASGSARVVIEAGS